MPKDTTGSWYIVVFWLFMLFRILEIDKLRVRKASFYIQKLTTYVFLTIYLVFPRLSNLISAKILRCPSYNASCLCFLLPLPFVLVSSAEAPHPAVPVHCPEHGVAASPLCFFCSVTMSDRKAVIKNADMSEDMQQDAVDCATQAMEKYNIEKDIAAYIKKVCWESCGWWSG